MAGVRDMQLTCIHGSCKIDTNSYVKFVDELFSNAKYVQQVQLAVIFLVTTDTLPHGFSGRHHAWLHVAM